MDRERLPASRLVSAATQAAEQCPGSIQGGAEGTGGGLTGEAGAGQHTELARSILRGTWGAEWADPTPPRQHQGRGELPFGIVGQRLRRIAIADAPGREVGGDGTAGTATARQVAGTAGGKGGVIDDAGSDQPLHHHAHEAAQIRERRGPCLGPGTLGPTLALSIQHTHQARPTGGVAGQVRQSGLVQHGVGQRPGLTRPFFAPARGVPHGAIMPRGEASEHRGSGPGRVRN